MKEEIDTCTRNEKIQHFIYKLFEELRKKQRHL